MTERERIAHHEGAHAVLAIMAGLVVADKGIDLDHADDQTGSSGGVCTSLYDIDLTGLEGAELAARQAAEAKYICLNGAIVAAGAASDAKLLNQDPWTALKEQPGDLKKMQWLLARAQLSPTPQIEETQLQAHLNHAVEALKNEHIWEAVKQVANCALRKNPLPGSDILAIAKPILENI